MEPFHPGNCQSRRHRKNGVVPSHVSGKEALSCHWHTLRSSNMAAWESLQTLGGFLLPCLITIGWLKSHPNQEIPRWISYDSSIHQSESPQWAPRTANKRHGRPVVSARSCTRCGHVADSIIWTDGFSHCQNWDDFLIFSNSRSFLAESCKQWIMFDMFAPSKDVAECICISRGLMGKEPPCQQVPQYRVSEENGLRIFAPNDRRKLHRSTHPLHAAVVDCSTSSLIRAEMPQASENLSMQVMLWYLWQQKSFLQRLGYGCYGALLPFLSLYLIYSASLGETLKSTEALHWPGIDQPRTSKIPEESTPTREEADSPDSPEDRQDAGHDQLAVNAKLLHTIP